MTGFNLGFLSGAPRGVLRGFHGYDAGLVGACAVIVAGALMSSPVQAGDLATYNQLDFGFEVFTEEQFDGNGRTCATCHLPEEQYTIAPSDIKKLKGKALQAVLASKVKGLENPTLVMERALFNVEGFGAVDDALDCDDEMECHGPVFRGSMFIAALDITGPVAGSPGAPPPVLGKAKIGWAANGSPGLPFGDPAVNRVHHGFFDADADGSIRAFATGAIAQHFTKSLDRVPGVDFRRATPDELDAMDALQRWLGRREEFDIGLMTFVDPIADDGRELYMTNGASCNTCHVNGGANFSTSIPNPDIHISQHTDVNSEAERLTEVTGVFVPVDEGVFADPPPPGPVGGDGEFEAFNSQSLIEATGKEVFFHNSAIITEKNGEEIEEGGGIEGAATFYFRGTVGPPGVREPGFVGSPVWFAITGLFAGGGGDGSGPRMDTLPDFLAFAESEGLATPENDGIEVLGAFLRSLSAFYKVRDCERLVAETIDRLGTPGASPQLSKKHCVFNLDDVKEVLSGAKVSGLYDDVIDGVKPFKKTLKVATAMGDTDTLEDLLCDLETMRDDIATTTEVIPSFCGP